MTASSTRALVHQDVHFSKCIVQHHAFDNHRQGEIIRLSLNSTSEQLLATIQCNMSITVGCVSQQFFKTIH